MSELCHICRKPVRHPYSTQGFTGRVFCLPDCVEEYARREGITLMPHQIETLDRLRSERDEVLRRSDWSDNSWTVSPSSYLAWQYDTLRLLQGTTVSESLDGSRGLEPYPGE